MLRYTNGGYPFVLADRHRSRAPGHTPLCHPLEFPSETRIWVNSEASTWGMIVSILFRSFRVGIKRVTFMVFRFCNNALCSGWGLAWKRSVPTRFAKACKVLQDKFFVQVCCFLERKTTRFVQSAVAPSDQRRSSAAAIPFESFWVKDLLEMNTTPPWDSSSRAISCSRVGMVFTSKVTKVNRAAAASRRLLRSVCPRNIPPRH